MRRIQKTSIRRIQDMEYNILEDIKRVADSVVAALEAQAANMANTDNTNRNFGPRETPDCKVKFATGTLTENALSWWNSYAKPIRIEQADKIAWTELKRLLTNKYCPRTEVKKMEDEFHNLVVKGNDLKTYARRF
ncbi:reverse transcriptase domain-containing protein [Tanacetum coccineum]